MKASPATGREIADKIKDRLDYEACQKRMEAAQKSGDGKAFQDAWRELDRIKNRHNGFPPENKMKLILIALYGLAWTAGLLFLLAICKARARKPPMNPEDRKEFDDHDV